MHLTADKVKLLSKGSNSSIYHLCDDDLNLVLKVVPSASNKEAKHLSNQYHVLKKLHHENIIAAYKHKQDTFITGIGQSPQLDSKCSLLVLQYAAHGSLLSFLKKNKLQITGIRYLLVNLAKAVEYLHCNYIVHRDLKLDNVLIAEQGNQAKVKLADFGFASHCIQNQQVKLFNTYKGTRRGYMAPQIHQVLKNSNKFYDARKSDIFALGIIFFAMVFSKLPFEYATKQDKIYTSIKEKNYSEFWKHHSQDLTKLELKQHSMPQDFMDLFISMTAYDPQERITIQEVIDHPWMQGLTSNIVLSE